MIRLQNLHLQINDSLSGRSQILNLLKHKKSPFGDFTFWAAVLLFSTGKVSFKVFLLKFFFIHPIDLSLQTVGPLQNRRQ